MNVNLLMSIVMVIVRVVLLILSFLFPGEITIGSFVASLAIAAFFYALHKKQKNKVHSY